MMRAAALRTMVRIEDLRLLRARGAFADALASEEAARAAHDQAQSRLQAARTAVTAADGNLRDRPQCEHRGWLRDLARERLLAATDAGSCARGDLDAAEAAARVARVVLGREEARATALDGLHRAARAGERNQRETREEEDRMIVTADV